MKELNKIINHISPSVTISLNTKAKELAIKGKDIINLSIGEPDFFTFDNIKEAGKKAIDNNKTRYTSEVGIRELREAISKKLEKENNIHYTPEQIVVCNGAKHALFNSFAAILNPGDEVIIPKPAWFTYKEQIKFFGGSPIFVDTDNNYRIISEKIEEAITENTKAILINSPSNPAGSVVSKKELTKIADLAIDRDIFVISDECYEHFVFDDKKHYSIASFGEDIKELTITINSVSKTYAMTGWRIGYLASNEKIVQAIANFQSQSTSHPCSIAQYAAVEALNKGKKSVLRMKNEFNKRRLVAYKMLSKISGIKCLKPEGAFYLFPKVDYFYGDKIKSSIDFCNFLLDKANVAIVPGKPFERDDCVRISYACSLEKLTEGITRINKILCEYL